MEKKDDYPLHVHAANVIVSKGIHKGKTGVILSRDGRPKNKDKCTVHVLRVGNCVFHCKNLTLNTQQQ